MAVWCGSRQIWFPTSCCCVLHWSPNLDLKYAKIVLWLSTILMERKGADKLLKESVCITFGNAVFHFHGFSICGFNQLWIKNIHKKKNCRTGCGDAYL
jgi:hypothetical protein